MSLRVLLCTLVVVLAVAPGTPAQQERRVARRADTPIAAHLRPGDRVVTIADDRPPPLFVNPPEGTSFAEWLIEIRALLFTGRIRQLRAAPTPGGDFIETTVVLDVDEILFEPDPERRLPATVSFTLPGGTMMIDGVHVRGELRWAHPPREGMRYLVAASRGGKGELVVGASSMFELDGEGPVRRLADVPFAADFGDLPELAVLTDLRAAAAEQTGRASRDR
ncbi:MAG TPA: hypothetical protein VIL25_09990 [Vicinamibacterales bacterium]